MKFINHNAFNATNMYNRVQDSYLHSIHQWLLYITKFIKKRLLRLKFSTLCIIRFIYYCRHG